MTRPRLNESERALLLEIIGSGTATRSTLSAHLGLSKATISGAMKQLEGAGLIAELGMEQGSFGRPAAVYQAAEAAGYSLGIDLGTTHVRVRAVAIDGRMLADLEASVKPSRDEVSTQAAEAAVGLVSEVAAALATHGSRLRRTVIAAPIKVSFDEPPPANLLPVIACLEALPSYPARSVAIENNVNCAAIAEGQWGAAQGFETFSYLQVGVKIGLGSVVEGRLLRGGQGGAGEVACLPYPWSSTDRPRRFGLEKHLGAASLVARARMQTDVPRQPAFDAASMFARAEAGDLKLRQVVDTHAREVGEMAAAVVAILDPGLIVLGGGVGQSPLLLNGVRAAVRKLSWNTEIRTSELGPDATVMGAARLAADTALTEVLAGDW
jgi:predicted NBD/HSP70 family sugar kinase